MRQILPASARTIEALNVAPKSESNDAAGAFPSTVRVKMAKGDRWMVPEGRNSAAG